MKILEVVVNAVSVFVGSGVVVLNTYYQYLKELILKSIMEIK